MRAPTKLVSPRARWYWATRAGLGWAVIFGVQTIVWVSAPESAMGHLVVAIVTATIAVVHLAVMPQWRFRVHRWESTESAVYTQSGWVSQDRRIAPIARIQTVDTHRGPFEQLFGLANVTITTASAAGPLRIHGLDLNVAQSLVEDLTARTQNAGDGT